MHVHRHAQANKCEERLERGGGVPLATPPLAPSRNVA